MSEGEGSKPGEEVDASSWSAIERAALEASRDPILKEMLEQERVVSDEVDAKLFVELVRYVRHHKGLAAFSVTLSVLEAGLMALPPFAIGLAIDVVRQSGAGRSDEGLAGALHGVASWIDGVIGYAPGVEGLIVAYGVMILCVWLVRWVMATATTYVVQMLGQRVVHDLRMDVYGHVIAMDMGYFHTNPVGRLVNRTTFDTKTLSEFFSDALAQGLRDILFLVVLIGVMLTLDVPLTAILLAAFPLLVAAGALYRLYARPAMRTTQAVMSRMNAWLAENIAGMRENQLYQTEGRRRGEFKALTDAHQSSVRSWISAWGWLRPLMMGISAVATTAVLYVGYGRVVGGAISVGVLLTFLQYTTRMWVPVRNLTEKFNMIQTALTATERIFDVLGQKSGMTDAPGAVAEAAVERGDLTFEGVRFAYPTKPESEILKGVDFSVEAGQMLALVGDTGAGKSTIVHLISRFYDVTGGAVKVDGRDVREYTLAGLRAGIAIVPQDVVIFAGTIRDNITLGLDVSDEVVWAACEAVCADRFIKRFPGRLDHVMDESGRTLSAGERQLLSFARALVYNPPILILDEATANVDTQTEALIQEALERLTKGRTSVVVAHRLSTIRDADVILVMRHGQVVERGTHDELLEMGGEYDRLHRLHMGGESAAA